MQRQKPSTQPHQIAARITTIARRAKHGNGLGTNWQSQTVAYYRISKKRYQQT